MSNQRIALVTGSTSGIGASTTRHFIKLGYTVIISGRCEKKLDKMCEEINTDDKHKVYSFCGDIKNENLIPEIFEFSHNIFGKHPDTLVFSAGIGLPGTVLSSDTSNWKTLVDVNYTSQLFHLRQSAQLLVEDVKNHDDVKDIVFIGSTVGRDISAANPVYGSTKAAMHYIIESLRRELSSHGIRLTLIEPGFVKSEFQDNAGYDREWFASVERQFGPLLTPSDIADVIGYVVTRSKHIHLDDIRLRPARQTL